MRNPHLHFALHNTSVATVPRDVFAHADYVRNITVDLHDNDLKTLENPSSAHKPGVPGKRFLLRLRMAGSHVNCDCDIGYEHFCLRFFARHSNNNSVLLFDTKNNNNKY